MITEPNSKHKMGMHTFGHKLKHLIGSDAYSQLNAYLQITVIFYSSLFTLNILRKQFRWRWLKLLSWGCYVSIPTLISSTIGAARGRLVFYFIWLPFALFGYSGFDNLICFSLQERYDRNVIFSNLSIQVLLLCYYAKKKVDLTHLSASLILPFLIVIIVACLKVMERIAALAHATGETEGVSESLRRVFNYTNMDEEDNFDQETMEGLKILVGPRSSEIKEDKIVHGISLNKIWTLKHSNQELKETCLSFSLFWLLLGKFYGYPLYEGRPKMKARKLVHEYLLGSGSEHERAFRVIEVELSFLHDYFYTKYFLFYLNGLWWKGLYLLAFLILVCLSLGLPFVYFIYSVEVIQFLLSLEVTQIGVFFCSKWFRVILVSYVAERKGSKKGNKLLIGCIEKVVKVISRISLYKSTLLAKLWKRQLDQYSLLEYCTSCGMDNKSWLRAIVGAALQIPVTKQGRKLSQRVTLSKDVKRAVVLSLHDARLRSSNGVASSPLHDTRLRLSNGVASLSQNEVENELSWACKLNKDAEVLLVWHIATSVCEMSHTSQQHTARTHVNFNVATNLSKYCAYLLAFSPSLLSIPLHEANLTCNTAIQDARKSLIKCSFLCYKRAETNKCEKLMEWLRGERGVGNSTGVLQSGLKLGEQLLSIVDDEKRWKILAELWAEMILFLAPSNCNELVHAGRLADGGEFITVLWALLIHAGVVDRQDLIRTPRADDEAGTDQSVNV